MAVISNRLWRGRFGASARALGRSVTLDGVSYTIAGVLPADFRFYRPEEDVYTPIGQSDRLQRKNRTVHNVGCVARLRPGVSVARAQTEINAVQNNIDQLYPTTERGLRTEIVPLKKDLVGDVSETLLLLLGAVGLVLLIACANVANLLLARSIARTREFAVRSALGASRRQIARQLITESVLLSGFGGAAGLALAKWGVIPLVAFMPGSLPRGENIGVDGSVLLFTLGVSIAVGMLFGLAPTLKSSRPNLESALKAGSRASTSAQRGAQSGRDVRGDFVRGCFARARDWCSHGAGGRKAEYFHDGDRRRPAAGSGGARDWSAGVRGFDAIAVEFFPSALWGQRQRSGYVCKCLACFPRRGFPGVLFARAPRSSHGSYRRAARRMISERARAVYFLRDSGGTRPLAR